ncbi:MAG: PQQ-dependent sugar dehydrogenase [Bdellovibrionaceae bacterium]|nr:PQQ-dependent sugar dehydrogenase [Pseudobdellovibrionaceae bacterium]
MKNLILMFSILLSVGSFAADVPAGFTDTRVASGLNNPTAMEFAPDGRLFIAEQGGALRVVKNNVLLPTPFLKVNVDSSGERGLLGIAIDPQFDSNKFVYIYYTTSTPTTHNRIVRVTANGDVMAAGSEVAILELDSLSTQIHNGGAIHFGQDGKLYIAVGENGNGSNSQSLSSLLGKMLRINKDGSIPSDNPFVGSGRGEIWAYGLRNPFTFSVNPKSGRIFINDVGQTTFEEINDGQRGANYGWPLTEGATNDPRFVSPLMTYGRSEGCAITGGAFYDPVQANFPAQFIGKYFFADFCFKYIRIFNPVDKTISGFATAVPAPVDLKVGSDGALYYLSRGDGSALAHVGKISSNTSQSPAILAQPQNKNISVGQNATFSVSASGSNLIYQWSRNGVNIAGANSASYTLTNAQLADSGSAFRVFVSNSFGSVTSNSAILTVTSNMPPKGTILTPNYLSKYNAGAIMSFSGTGTDPESGALPASAFTWRIDFHHDTHIHPAMPSTVGIKSGTYAIPNQGEVSDTVFYRVTLIVKDSAGLTHRSIRDVRPNKATLTLTANIAGLSVNIDGQPKASPYVFTGVVGMLRNIAVTSPQTLNGKTYKFSSWSDQGAIAHNITTPAANTTYTANFSEVITSAGSF